MKLKVLILLTLALLAFSAQALVTTNVSAPELRSASTDTIKNVSLPVQPCGDPIEDEPDLPH